MTNNNFVFFDGNLCADPVVKKTKDGVSVCNFKVAVNQRFKSKSGDDVENVSFIPCMLWDSAADYLQEHYKKNDKISIMGELRTKRFGDDNKTEMSVRVNNFKRVC